MLTLGIAGTSSALLSLNRIFGWPKMLTLGIARTSSALLSLNRIFEMNLLCEIFLLKEAISSDLCLFLPQNIQSPLPKLQTSISLFITLQFIPEMNTRGT